MVDNMEDRELRVTALAQANTAGLTDDQIITRAKAFYRFLSKDSDDTEATA